MNTIKVVAVFGYNNTRIYDLFKIRQTVRDRLDAAIVLVKEGIVAEDREVTPYCFDHRPEDPHVAGPLREFLARHGLEMIGCLPFSDKGVIGAANAAQAFGLVGDDATTAFAMLDKGLFRRLEARIELDDRAYKKPFFVMTTSLAAARDLLTTKGPYFIKPVAEGNSRGCMKLESIADLDKWHAENPKALANGVICEENLSNTNEFSFDGVAGNYWITQKFTTSGRFRAEYQHIMPAPLTPDVASHVHGILQPLLRQLGSHGGAFHHEFFLLDDGRVASVEPNRRPAGMWLWDLASWAFLDFNPWQQWVDHCGGRTTKTVDSLSPRFFAGVRGVIVQRDMTMRDIDAQTIETRLKDRFGDAFMRLAILKKPGDKLRAEPRDNSDFVAFVGMRHAIYEDLVVALDEAQTIILDVLESANAMGAVSCAGK